MKTVLITGSNRGLGKALAEAFLEAGHKLILPTRFLVGDLAKPETIFRIIGFCQEQNVDIIINNAALYEGHNFLDIMQVNFFVPRALILSLWDELKERKGMIININSLAGKQGGPGEEMYAASKHALKGFSESKQFDATKDNIRILDVFLGAMQTDMTKHRDNYKKLIDPKEVAETILQLIKNRKTMRITELTINRRLY